MRRLLLVGLVVCSGCQGVVGPLERRCAVDPTNLPCISPEEQQQRFRDRLALPEASRAVAPRTYAEEPALRGP